MFIKYSPQITEHYSVTKPGQQQQKGHRFQQWQEQQQLELFIQKKEKLGLAKRLGEHFEEFIMEHILNYLS